MSHLRQKHVADVRAAAFIMNTKHMRILMLGQDGGSALGWHGARYIAAGR